MVTEVVEIVIREKGAAATSRQITRVGRSSRSAARGVALLVSALAALAAGRGLAAIAKDAVSASAAFEQYGVRLGALLGSQTEANKALDNFVELSAKTPFAVSQIVEGASTLGAAALGNRERLEELTVTAANLAAVTGLSFQEAAGNLQRSLQAGIGAADLFRERGVRALIESIAGIPDATKASSQELEAAFGEVFGAGGVFGTAAENLSTTLGGALSNIGDAATNLQVALGDAFAPSVINTARGVIIPFLTQLQGEVVANEEAIGRFAGETIRSLLEGFLSTAQAGLALIQTFDQVDTAVTTAFANIAGTVLEVVLSLAEATEATQEFLGSLGVDNAAELQATRDSIASIKESIDEFATSEIEATQASAVLEGQLDSLNDRIVGLQTSLRSADLSVDPREAAPDIDLSGAGGAAGGLTGEQIQSQEAALARVEALTNRIRVAEAARVDPLDAQLERLRQQEAALIAAANASGDFASSAEGLALIENQTLAIETQKTSELERQAVLQAEITRLIGEATILSPELAQEIREAAEAAVAAGGGLEKVNDALEGIGEKAESGLEDAREEASRFGQTLENELGRGIGAAVSGAISGEGVDAVQLLADTAGALVTEALQGALKSGFAGIGDIFGGGGAAGGGGGGGGGFNLGGALTAGLTAGLTILSGALRDTSSDISNNLIRSAATQSSAAATRGVIAGPTSIPIFQVGQQLEAALNGTNDILEQILAAILVAPQAGAGGGAQAAAAALETTTPNLT